VADTGIGIDPQDLEVIFESFYQTGAVEHHFSGDTQYKAGGPGLGLTIARGLIEAHGGKIWAESAAHDEARYPGSRFHIQLPIRKLDKKQVMGNES
jgi:signal transduction histidine kinase